MEDIVSTAASNYASISHHHPQQHQPESEIRNPNTLNDNASSTPTEFHSQLQNLEADTEMIQLLFTAIKQNQNLETKLRTAEKQRVETLQKLSLMQKRLEKEKERVVKCSEKVFTLNSNYHINSTLFSPDGTCLLLTTSTRSIGILDTPQQLYAPLPAEGFEQQDTNLSCVSVSFHSPEPIYSTAWFPSMRSSEPHSCAIAVASRDHPVQLIDAYSGEVRGAYTAIAKGDVVTAPHSVTFSCDGGTIYAGLEGKIHSFDVSVQGPPISILSTTPTRKSRLGQKGILSHLSSPQTHPHLLLAGSFSKSVGVYDTQCAETVAVISGADGGVSGSGVTQVEVLPDGVRVLVASRGTRAMQLFDLRYLGGGGGGGGRRNGGRRDVVGEIERDVVGTNQRFSYSVSGDGRVVGFGDKNGFLNVFNLGTMEIVERMRVSREAVCGVSISPYYAPPYESVPEVPALDTSMDGHVDTLIGTRYWVSACSGERQEPASRVMDSDTEDDMENSTVQQVGESAEGPAKLLKMYEFTC
ncbi:Telomerase Cajal body protein 1 [Chytriomyces hyalinus]|nr:Telomerase Cajal body protein 1 [Chytriomyces hyalinus]